MKVLEGVGSRVPESFDAPSAGRSCGCRNGSGAFGLHRRPGTGATNNRDRDVRVQRPVGLRPTVKRAVKRSDTEADTASDTISDTVTVTDTDSDTDTDTDTDTICQRFRDPHRKSVRRCRTEQHPAPGNAAAKAFPFGERHRILGRKSPAG